MKRLLIINIFILSTLSAAVAAPPRNGAVKGRVAAGGRPMEGVVVSDGDNFAVTDSKGVFSLESSEEAPFVFIVTPSGYVAESEDGFPRFYLPRAGRRSYDFELKAFGSPDGGFELLAIGDPQPQTEEHMSRLQSEIMPALTQIVGECRQRNALPEAAILLGDIVWDRMYLMPRVREIFSTLGIPVYPVIGNHDHDLACDNDFDATHAYRENFGPAYYAFDMGGTHFIVLDDIEYYGKKEYDERVSDRQLAWVEKYTAYLPEGERVCVAMHAPAMKYWRDRWQMSSNRRLMKLLSKYELHFLTGHSHINSNYDITPGVVEHNVGQVNGNLWHAPLNSDGSTKGLSIITESDGRWSWLYRTLGQGEDYQMRIWLPGELKEHKPFVVAKIWGWDPCWTVVWYEDGRYRGAMERLTMTDPDYMAFVDTVRVEPRIRRNLLKSIRNAEFYFRALPSADAREVRIVATDRDGRQWSQTVTVR